MHKAQQAVELGRSIVRNVWVSMKRLTKYTMSSTLSSKRFKNASELSMVTVETLVGELWCDVFFVF